VPNKDVWVAVKEYTFSADAIREGRRLLVVDSDLPRKVMNINTWPHLGAHLRSDHFFKTLDLQTQDLIKEHTRYEHNQYIKNLKYQEIFTGWDQNVE
jgi:hypothetical protein